MGTKRLGLARVEALLEAQDRALAMGGSDLTVETLTADNGVTATAGGLNVTAGDLNLAATNHIYLLEQFPLSWRQPPGMAPQPSRQHQLM